MPDEASTATATAPPDDTAASRRVARRRSLPGGRAVVGAFLVTLAAVGVFAAWLQATAPPTTEYVTVVRTLAPGDVVTADHLGRVALDLPAAQAAAAFTDPERVAGRVALSPLHAGELVGRGDVRAPAEVAGTSSLTFALDTSRALGGRLEAGDHVDLVATADGETRFVAVDLPLVGVAVDGAETTVTLALPDPTTVLAVAHAVDTADVLLARTNPDLDTPLTDLGARSTDSTVDTATGPATRAPSPSPADTSGQVD